jgi:hypothetical protein
MSAKTPGILTLRGSAALVLVGAILSGPVAVAVVNLSAPQPAWQGVEVFVASYHWIQTLPYLFGYLLLAGFVCFTAACHARAGERRAATSAALICTGVYAVLVFTNYTLQVGFIPRSLSARPEYLALLTMANPRSFAWFLEMFGYAAMGAATWLLAAGFGGDRRGELIRYLLMANGIASIAGAAFVSLRDAWVFSASGLVSFALWNAIVVIGFGLIAITDEPTSPDERKPGITGPS